MFEAKNILITGCSSGIGKATAELLNQQGYNVIATARQAPDVETLEQAGFTSFELDMASSESIREAVKQISVLFGGELDAVFHNAAYGQPGAIEDLPTDAFRAQFESNLFGIHELTRLLLPDMIKRRKGRIILNSSVLGFVTMPYRGAYNASKFALTGWADTLRLELRGTGVDVVLLEPGPINTRFRANAYAAFKQNIKAEGSRHEVTYQQMIKNFEASSSPSRFAMSSEQTAAVVLKALRADKPKIHYGVTLPTHVFRVLKKILPSRWLDWILSRS